MVFSTLIERKSFQVNHTKTKSLALELVRRTPMRQLRIDRTIWTTRKCDDELILLTSASFHISDTFASVYISHDERWLGFGRP